MDVLNKQKEKLKGVLSDKAPSQPAIQLAAPADLVEKPAEKPADKPAEVRVKPDPKKIAIEWLKFRPIWSFLGVVFVAWVIGYFGFFIVWALWLVPVCLSWAKIVIQREKRLEETRVRLALAHEQSVPARFESAEWVNRLMFLAMNNFKAFAANEIETNAAKSMEKNVPPMISKMVLQDVNLGTSAPVLSNVYVYPTEPSLIKMEADMRWASDFSLVFAVYTKMAPTVALPTQVKDIFVAGRFCVEVDLLPGPPFAKRLRFRFLQTPQIDVTVRPVKVGPDVLSVPGLHEAIWSMCNEQINAQMVGEKFLDIPLSPEEKIQAAEQAARDLQQQQENKREQLGLAGVLEDNLLVEGFGKGLEAGKALGDSGINAVKGVGNLGAEAASNTLDAGKSGVQATVKLGKNILGAPAALLGKKKSGSSSSGTSSSSSQNVAASISTSREVIGEDNGVESDGLGDSGGQANSTDEESGGVSSSESEESGKKEGGGLMSGMVNAPGNAAKSIKGIFGSDKKAKKDKKDREREKEKEKEAAKDQQPQQAQQPQQESTSAETSTSASHHHHHHIPFLHHSHNSSDSVDGTAEEEKPVPEQQEEESFASNAASKLKGAFGFSEKKHKKKSKESVGGEDSESEPSPSKKSSKEKKKHRSKEGKESKESKEVTAE